MWEYVSYYCYYSYYFWTSYLYETPGNQIPTWKHKGLNISMSPADVWNMERKGSSTWCNEVLGRQKGRHKVITKHTLCCTILVTNKRRDKEDSSLLCFSFPYQSLIYKLHSYITIRAIRVYGFPFLSLELSTERPELVLLRYWQLLLHCTPVYH
jgi:hypothetical protein